MRSKYIVWYLLCILVLLAVTTVFKGWIDFAVIPLWIGGLIGVFLPEVDHLIYAYFLRPHELDSQRMQRMINQGQVVSSVEMGTENRSSNSNLIFHSIFFQVIFLLFAVFVVTSTGSLLGRGLVLGFLVNLAVDQYFDLKKTAALENWFQQVKVILTRQQAKLYLLAQVIAIFVLAIIF